MSVAESDSKTSCLLERASDASTALPRPSDLRPSVGTSLASSLPTRHRISTAESTPERFRISTASPRPPELRGDGLTSREATELEVTWGPNEVPKIVPPIWKIILQQFIGVMPFMLEISCLVSGIAQDWPDFGLILAMLVVNAILGLREELKAKKALDELTNSMESQVTVLRDGMPHVLGVTKLVPGDAIHMRGGTMTPADVEWLRGDILSVDTAALTGEPIPRKYPSAEYGTQILSGSTVKSGEAYCIVRATGVNTEIGKGQADIAADRASASVSVFEQRVRVVVNIIIFLAVLDTIALILVQGFVRDGFKHDQKATLLTALSILIAAVPVALPLVLQVTMAIGAYRMATRHNAIVTRMSALQDIASMDVLCSDKTGTLTTAKMSINFDLIWPAVSRAFENFATKSDNGAQDAGKQQVLLVMAMLAANKDKRDDAIDGAVIRAFEKFDAEQSGELSQLMRGYKQLELTGFNPEVKRTVAKVQEVATGKVFIVAKGLVSKVLDTSTDGVDSGARQWRCAEVDEVAHFKEAVREQDERLAGSGYKTLAVAVGDEGESMHFLGLLPMIDPPRSDTAQTVQRISEAGVELKMITGDHLNIAIETARLVGMPTNILPGEMTREANCTRDELVRVSGGFAQVLPCDKRECVLILQRSYGLVVGMTGDGVNDAPALSAAQCGIAVDDATDAAKGAAAMILTTEGLSAVFGAVVESRKIFKRLFSYISYRLASTIQVLLYLSVLVYVFDCCLNPLYVILLALFNDITMIPVAEDRQTASAAPQHANIGNLIGFSVLLGVMQSIMSITYYISMQPWGLVKNLDAKANFGYPSSTHAQNAIWLQVSIAAELLIFVARSPGLFFFSRPSLELFVSTMLGNVICTLLAVYAFSEPLDWDEVGLIVAWDVAGLFLVDFAKMFYKYSFEHDVAGIIDEAKIAAQDAQGGSQADGGDGSSNRLASRLSTTNDSYSHVSQGSVASFAAFMSTGKAPYVQSRSLHGASGSGFRATLHPRTPGIMAQHQSLSRSVHAAPTWLHYV